ncbi:MAG: hypothetical protein PVI86_13235 [Phycisphaerae bacterium]|jgi:hypothetical protein
MRRNPNPVLSYLVTLFTVTATASAGDFVDGRGPDPGRETPRLPRWQQAELNSPEIVAQEVNLPPTRSLEIQPESTEGVPSDSEKIGYVEPFDKRLLPAWPFRRHDNQSAVAHVEFRSDGACGLRLRLENFDPGARTELRFYDPAGTTVLGPFRTPRLDEEGGWWSPTIFGDTIGVELYAPDGIDNPEQAPEVTEVAFLEGGTCIWAGGTTLGCHNDVVCHADWDDNEARAVALIYFVSGSTCHRCTGALLNRNPDDLSPLFMTANHCISSAGEADSVEVYWFYETPSCNGTPPTTPATQPRNLGSLRLKRYSAADWTLLGLYEPPVSGVYYLGWDANDWEYGETATGVHHPRGTFKRISFGESRGSSERTFCDSSGTVCHDAEVRRVRYTNGTTEPGSSGSPIFDGSRRVRGTLTGGDNDCPNVSKYYGRFYLAWDHLRYYMGEADIASPVYVNSAVAGDPGNNGNSERGTAAQPFNTVHEASYAVRSNDELLIEPGNYDERFTIWRPMTLNRSGSSGAVEIGQ